MVGAFARADEPIRTPPERLQENHPQISCWRLYREGCFVENWRGEIDTGDGGCWPAVRTAGKIIVSGQAIELVSHECLPAPVFLCGFCGATKYKLYYSRDGNSRDGVWACSQCLGLDRSSRHLHRSLRGLHKLRQLRRKINAPELFSPIAPRPITARKFWRDVVTIRAIEGRLASLGCNKAAVLQKRYASKRRRRSADASP